MRSLKDLLKIADRNGISVMTVRLEEQEPVSTYCDALRLISISDQLLEYQATAALAHELIHAAHEHRGHQTPAIERIVDELAARMILTVDEYAKAETMYGCDPRAIAHEMGQPVWIIEAFQRHLAKTEYRTAENTSPQWIVNAC